MRFMLTCRVPMEEGNAAIKDGSLPETIRSIMEDLKPEAAYFTTMGGHRGAYFVVDMEDASQMVAMAEPIFLGLGATVEFQPLMTAEDLAKAAPSMEHAAKSYG